MWYCAPSAEKGPGEVNHQNYKSKRQTKPKILKTVILQAMFEGLVVTKFGQTNAKWAATEMGC